MMETLRLVFSVIHLVVCAALILLVVLQSNRGEGLSGAITGGSNSDTFFGKNKSRSREAAMSRWTVVIASIFVVLVVILNMVEIF